MMDVFLFSFFSFFLNVHSSSESRYGGGLISGSSSLCVEVSLSKILNPAHLPGVRMLQGYKLFNIENEQ